VVVAVIPVWMVQMSVDQVIDVVAVRHRLVPASLTVDMMRVVPAAPVLRCAPVGIGRRHLDGVLVDVIAMHMMQMAVVEVIHVVAMANGRMSAAGTVLVRVVGVLAAGAGAHGWPQGSPVAGHGPAASSPVRPGRYAIPAQRLQDTDSLEPGDRGLWCPPGKPGDHHAAGRRVIKKRRLAAHRSCPG
jgi:hypothetical protein